MVNTASIWIRLLQPHHWSLGHFAPSLSPQPHGQLALTYTVHSHRNTLTHTLLVGRDCITLTLTAAGLSFINAPLSGIICCALYRTVIIQVIC